MATTTMDTDTSDTTDTTNSKDSNPEMKETSPESALETLSLSNQENKPDSGNTADTTETSSSDDDSDGSSSEDDSDDEMFDGLSAEQIAKMKAAMGNIQSGWQDHCAIEKERVIRETKEQIKFNLAIIVSDAEASFIGDFMKENNLNLTEHLEDEGIEFLANMKTMMDQANAQDPSNTNTATNDDEFEFSSESDHDEDWVAAEKQKKAARAAKRREKNKNADGSKRCGRLLLNDALKNVGSMEGWSEARKKAWTNRKTSPNAYFYRFNVPGQPQAGGKWTASEHKLFMQRVLDIGVNDQWGLFSKRIPGRVGYQCSNYWRGLVKDGDVKDPNYHYDGKKLHFKRNTKAFAISSEYRKFAITVLKDKSGVWKPLPMKHPKHPSDEYCAEVKAAMAAAGTASSTSTGKSKAKRKRKRKEDEDEDWDAGAKSRKKRKRAKKGDDGDFHCSVSVPARKEEEDDNPMRDFIDIMTGTGVEKPAMSPYGHVLGYETWTMLLRTSKHKNVCPFTMQKLTRRSLVKLTKANYDEYKDQIRNISAAEQQNMALMK